MRNLILEIYIGTLWYLEISHVKQQRTVYGSNYVPIFF